MPHQLGSHAIRFIPLLLCFLLYSFLLGVLPLPTQALRDFNPNQAKDSEDLQLSQEQRARFIEMLREAPDHNIHIDEHNKLHVYFDEGRDINDRMVGWLVYKPLLLPGGEHTFHINYVGPAPRQRDEAFPQEMQEAWLRHYFELNLEEGSEALGMSARTNTDASEILAQVARVEVEAGRALEGKGVARPVDQNGEDKAVLLFLLHYNRSHRVAQQPGAVMLDPTNLAAGTPPSVEFHNWLAASPHYVYYSQHLYVGKGELLGWASYYILTIAGRKSAYHLNYVTRPNSKFSAEMQVELVGHLFEELKLEGSYLGLSAEPESCEHAVLEKVEKKVGEKVKEKVGAEEAALGWAVDLGNGTEIGLPLVVLRYLKGNAEVAQAAELGAHIIDPIKGLLNSSVLAQAYHSLLTVDEEHAQDKHLLYLDAKRENILGWAVYNTAKVTGGKLAHRLVHIGSASSDPHVFTEEQAKELALRLFHYLRWDRERIGVGVRPGLAEHKLLEAATRSRVGPNYAVWVGNFKEEKKMKEDEEMKKEDEDKEKKDQPPVKKDLNLMILQYMDRPSQSQLRP